MTKTQTTTGPIYQDDPEAVTKLNAKLVELEKEKAYWKTIKKCVPRDYSRTPEDAKWYMPGLVNAKIRAAKKKIETIKVRQEAGITLERQTIFKEGQKRFFYKEVQN